MSENITARGSRGKTSRQVAIGGRFAAHGLRPSVLAPVRIVERDREAAVRQQDHIKRMNANNEMQAALHPYGAAEDGTMRPCPHCRRHFPNGMTWHRHVSGCLPVGDGPKPQICPLCGLMCPSRRERGLHQFRCCSEGAD